MAWHLQDRLNLLSKLTPQRFWNICKVIGSYYYSRLTNSPYHLGRPFTVSFEPTTACNLRCPECPSGQRAFTRATGMLHENLFKRVIDEIADDLYYLIFYFQGEPYLNPNFLDLVAYAHEKKIYTATSTNGHFLDDENAQRTIKSGLDRLIISIDGTTQETYESYRKGGQLEKVLEGARNIERWKEKLNARTPHTIFQFLVVRPNEHQIDEVYELADKIGIDEVKLKTAQIYDYKNGHPLIPKNEKYSRYRKKKDGTYEIKNSLSSHCWKLWHACVITWDGKVVPCCFDKDAKYQLGDLQEQTFEELWNSKPYRKFRKSVLQSRQNIDICKNCTEGTKVWV